MALSKKEFGHLIALIGKKPLSIVFFDEDETDSLHQSKSGLNRFTSAIKHSALEKVSAPCTCILETNTLNKKEYFLGTITDKSAITTFDSRVTIKKLHKINIACVSDLSNYIAKNKGQKRFIEDIARGQHFITLTPAPSKQILEGLIKDKNNHEAFKSILEFLPNYNRNKHINETLQKEADDLALKIFGIDLNKKEFHEEERLYEDNIIFHDFHNLEGFEKIAPVLTTKVRYRKKDEILTLYHANKMPLEKMLGVDLVYVNEVTQSIVMLQYKMLEKSGDDWVFRPDELVEKEINRMVIPAQEGVVIDDYRLHSNPFFFYFVKRVGNNSLRTPMIISLEHYQKIVASAKSKGPKGGTRIGYNELNGCYLRKDDIIGLIRSGYIGTHALETQALQPIIERVSKGSSALVIAWEEKIAENKNKNKNLDLEEEVFDIF